MSSKKRSKKASMKKSNKAYQHAKKMLRLEEATKLKIYRNYK